MVLILGTVPVLHEYHKIKILLFLAAVSCISQLFSFSHEYLHEIIFLIL